MLKKYKQTIFELFIYGIFGVLTTLVNISVYYLFSNIIALNYIISNVIAWIISVIFAFITNKLFVFRSKEWITNIWIKEMLSFFCARLVTGLLDMGIMFVMISILLMNDVVVKIISNIIVILVNFVFSKLVIFRKK